MKILLMPSSIRIIIDFNKKHIEVARKDVSTKKGEACQKGLQHIWEICSRHPAPCLSRRR